jgi:SagB-type dehydrogenase family enzyme
MEDDRNHYHVLTRHSWESVRKNPNPLAWEKQPIPFKIYNNFLQMIKLDDANPLHRFIYRIGGITAKKVYPGVEYYLRTIPSAGALYPVECYFQAREVEGFEDGIYHFDVRNSAVKLLHRLAPDEGVEVHFEDNRQIRGLLFLLSTVYYRSAWKYRERAFRYCLLDCGHAHGTIEASAWLYDYAANVRYRFDKKALNAAFGFGDREFFLSSVVTGAPGSAISTYLDMALEDINPPYERNAVIERAYHDTLVLRGCRKERRYSPFGFDKARFEEVIYKRRSIREFTGKPISKGMLDLILEHLRKPILSDCDEPVSCYYVVNRVEGMKQGLYLDDKLLKEGDFSEKAGYLCLEQRLGSESAVTFFLTSGARNYQPAYQKAGHLGHRLYLVSEYLGLGCSGIGAYYDDETAAFLDTDEMILYALAVGR